jgi:hypothetical protein
VRAVDGDPGLCEVDERGLLRVTVGDGLESGENDGICSAEQRCLVGGVSAYLLDDVLEFSKRVTDDMSQ